MNSGARIAFGRKNHMLETVVARQIKYVVAEDAFVELRGTLRILRKQRTPNPLAGRRQEIPGITTARGDHRERRAVRIAEHRLTAATPVRGRLGQHLAPAR